MSRGIAAATSHRRYGALDSVPDVAFADPTTKADLERSCEKVANNMHLINKYMRELKRDVDKIGTAKDSQNIRNSVQDYQLKCNELMKQSMEDLQAIGNRARGAEKETKLQVERLQGEMQTLIPSYGNLQKQAVEKSRQYILQQPVSPTEDLDQFHLREQEAAYNQQQQQIQRELEFEGGMLADRLSKIKTVEVEVLDINSMMRMLATMVHEQTSVLDTIEQNTENTLANVESANQELYKAAGHVGRRRRTVYCIALVVIVLLIIILVIVFAK